MGEISIDKDSMPNLNYSRIKFDIRKIKNINKIYAKYHIAQDENIIAYMKSSVVFLPLSADGIIITDKAIYHHPSHDDWSTTNKVSFSDLCKYVLLMIDYKSELILVSSEESHIIIGNTLFGTNKNGIELQVFLAEMQEYLVSKFDWVYEQRKTETRNLISKSKQLMREGHISENIRGALQILKADKNFYNEITLIESEYIFRQCDMDKFRKFINDIYEAEVRQQIKDSINKFKDELISDLGMYRLTIDSDFLKTMQENILKRENLSNEDYIALSYICIRLRDYSNYNTYLGHLQKFCEQELIQKLDFFEGSYYNIQMKQVYEAIKGGSTPSAECLELTDSMGLNALHYAIILKRKDIVDNILNAIDWRGKSISSTGNETADRIYDYIIVAALVSYDDLMDICYRTSEIFISMTKMLNALKRRLWIKEKFCTLKRNSLSGLYSSYQNAQQNGEYEQAKQFYNAWQEGRDSLLDMEDAVREAQHEINDLTRDISLMAIDMADEAREEAAELKRSKNPFVQFFIKLFENPVFLFHILNGDYEDCRLYIFGAKKFAVPADVDIELMYYDDFSGELKGCYNTSEKQGYYKAEKAYTESERITKPYGDSWFSPEAHRDERILKKEYLKLAKQYHPDVCGHSKSTKIFQDISSERCDILDSMK